MVKKAVRFDDNGSVHHIERRQAFTPSEAKEIWYHKQELQVMRSGLARMIRIANETMESDKNAVLDPEEYCLRGLEFRMTKELTRIRQDLRKQSFAAVLEEQKLQNEAQHHDELLIASLYRMACGDCISEAREMGLQDEEDASKIHAESMASYLTLELNSANRGPPVKLKLTQRGGLSYPFARLGNFVNQFAGRRRAPSTIVRRRAAPTIIHAQ